MVGRNFPNLLLPASTGVLKISFSHNSPMYPTGSRIRAVGVPGEHRQQERQVTKISRPSVQPANHEVAVVTHHQIQTKFLRFSFLGEVWQDQVGMIDRAWVEPPVLVARQFA